LNPYWPLLPAGFWFIRLSHYEKQARLERISSFQLATAFAINLLFLFMLVAGRLCIALLLFFLWSCQSEDLVVAPANLLEDGLVSFSFLQSDNKGLPADIPATISGTSITATLPAGIAKENLVASFTTRSTGTKVYIGNKAQTSRTTPNNYSTGLVYKAISADGKVFSYRVALNPAFVQLDAALDHIMQRHHIPGLSVAITKNDKLVFAKSYGYADKQSGELVSNESRFRIASLSKPVTCAAVLKLVQDGKMALSDKVFGPGGILGNTYGPPPAGSNIDLITVQDLLAHKSGWTNNPDDPLFGAYSLTARQVIENQVRHRPLAYFPGSTYYYSNLGYCILGRVIEKISGKSYAAFVKEDILQPASISGMQLAGDTEQQQAPNEVKYYQSAPNPYAFNMTRMDAHGGWIATATDMMRFMTLVDRNSGKQDLINSALLETTYFGSPAWSHYGSLPGTTAVITRLDEEYSFVVLANTRNNDAPNLIAEDLNNTLKGMILTQAGWPESDLFENMLVARTPDAITPDAMTR
jgi:CubicO group peptidase (beta-lactamase class C family)